ncbi:LytTr DNA-binding domain-containing protein [Spirosomataceae bacterium TFI 002]|nr:LytTr DNA-binding domain-containing protein [Spirosomataceae bacterium TFI 002]
MDYYYLKRNDSIQLIDIVFLEALENYTLFYLSNGSKIISSSTLKRHQEKLPENSFVRINRSMMINTRHIRKIFCKNDTNFIRMKNGRDLKVSRRRRDTLDLIAS